MAIKIYEQFAPFANPADGDYPQGSFKNDSIPGAEDGTPLDAVWANDYAGSDAELFAQAGIVPNGQPDKLGASQRMEAMRKVLLPRVDIRPPIQGRDSRFQLTDSKIALRVGISDAVPLDDFLGNWRNLPSKDAWGDAANMGNGSACFGRNNAGYAYLSGAFGHDNIVFGAAGFSIGASNAVGDPDNISNNTSGYCSIALGKSLISKGRASSAFGELNEANTDHSEVSGYQSKTGPGLSSHPNAEFPNQSGYGVVSSGDAAHAKGHNAEAYGSYAFALGENVRAYNGSVVIGSGSGPTALLQGTLNRGLVFGSYCTVPALSLAPDGGVHDKVGFNTVVPNERFESVLNGGDTFAVRTNNIGGSGNGKLALQGTLSDSSPVDIFSIDWNSPSLTAAQGTTVIKQNGNVFAVISSDGVIDFAKTVRIGVGGNLFIGDNRLLTERQPAISDALSTDAKVAAILSAMRAHGLIES